MVRRVFVVLSFLFSAAALGSGIPASGRPFLNREPGLEQAHAVQAGPLDGKIDPALALTLRRLPGIERLRVSGASPRAVEEGLESLPTVADAGTVPVIVRTDDEGAARSLVSGLGGLASSFAGGYLHATVPYPRVADLAASPSVLYVNGVYRKERELNVSRPAIGANQVQSGTGLPAAYRGTGVLVGIIDTGLDLMHKDFRDDRGKTRVLYYWDTSGIGKPPEGFNVGSECTAELIDAGLCRMTDRDGHGTHVAGIAAGNGRTLSGYFTGIAPDANLIIVKDDNPSVTVTQAVDYVVKRAQSLGRPVAINYSAGWSVGAHDGTDPEEVGVSSLVGPGKIFFKSAGNQGDQVSHFRHVARGTDYASGTSTGLKVNILSRAALDIWGDGSQAAFGVAGRVSGIAFGADVKAGEMVDILPLKYQGVTYGWVTIDARQASPSPGSGTTGRVLVSLEDALGGSSLTQWEVYTYGSGQLDAWSSVGSFTASGGSGFVPGDSSMTITMPGTGTRVITVGSSTTKTTWIDVDGYTRDGSSACGLDDTVVGRISCFSSRGPTRDGRLKPDVTAPGQYIASPMSTVLDTSNPALRKRMVGGGSYLVMQGTSQAAPHATGLAALMLEARPTLTPEDVRQYLQKTARADENTGVLPNATWGYGKVDALAAMKAVVAAPTPDFTLTVAPSSLSLAQGASGTTTATTAVAGGFGSTISLVVSGLPAGTTGTFSPSSIAAPGSGSSQLSISTSSATPIGTYPLTVIGTGGGITKTAPLSLAVTSGGATASRMLPVVLDVGGVPPARFSTELTLANRGTTDSTLTMTYTAATALGATGSGTVTELLAAGTQRVLPDAIAYLRGKGLPIPAASNEGGTLLVRFDRLSSPEASFAGARITTPSGTGRAGLAFPAVRVEDGFSSEAWVYGLRENSADRSNLALVNLDLAASVALRVTLWDAAGTRSLVVSPDTVLGPGQWTQMSRVLAQAGFVAGYAQVRKVAGAGLFHAYGVFNDNATNDGSYVPPLARPRPAEAVTLPVLVESSTFGSEMVLANFSDRTASVSLSYTESLTPSGGAGGTVTESLGPLEQRIVPDAIDYLRSKGVKIGPRGAAGYAGALKAAFGAAGSAEAGFLGARTASPALSGGGQYGVFYTSWATSEAVSSEAWVYGLQQNASVRSNLAIVNVGDAGGADTFRYDVYDGATGRLVGTGDVPSIGPGGWFQVGNVLSGYGAAGGYVRVYRTSGNDRFVAYGVVNDGASPTSGATNDGSFIGFSNR